MLKLTYACVVTQSFVHLYTSYMCIWQINLYIFIIFTSRHSYAIVDLGVVILSVCLSVYHARAL